MDRIEVLEESLKRRFIANSVIKNIEESILKDIKEPIIKEFDRIIGNGGLCRNFGFQRVKFIEIIDVQFAHVPDDINVNTIKVEALFFEEESTQKGPRISTEVINEYKENKTRSKKVRWAIGYFESGKLSSENNICSISLNDTDAKTIDSD